MKFTSLSAAINYLISINRAFDENDIANIGLEIELRGEIYL